MNNLSIVIKENKKENIYKFIKILEPLLQDGKTQLVIINNLEETLNLEYSHIIYKYEEDYSKFKEFCYASCLYDNIMIVERGIVLNEQFIKKIKELLLKYKNANVKCNFKKYFTEDKYYIKESYIVYNLETSFEEKLKSPIDDFSYLSDLEGYIEHNIFKFIEDNKIKELYFWYKSSIIKDYNRKLEFYNYLEILKMNIGINIKDEVEEYFILENLDFKYCIYLLLDRAINDKSLSIGKIKNVIQEAKFDKEDKYFRYSLLKLFKNKEYINEIFSLIEIEYIKIFMNDLFKQFEDFYLIVYEYLISTSPDEISQNKNILINMNIIEIYFENMSSCSEDRIRKEKIIKLFKIYSNQSTHIIKGNIIIDDKRKDFLFKLDKISDLINLNKIKDAIDLLKEVCEVYEKMKMPIRYYIQKLIYENSLYHKVLSITMIVKNEENNLERCLNSLVPLIKKGLAELIIVDTGSSDKTVDIANRYTDKVYFHPWQGSFSEARNWSISLANGEYIFIMDADYEMPKSEVHKLVKFFSGKGYKEFNTFSVKIMDYEDEELKKHSIIPQYLIFRNEGSFYYSGNVHNQPNFKKPIKNLDLTIFHYGYIMDNKAKKQGKFKRTANLLKKELQKDPTNIYYRFQLAHSYSMHDEHIESLNQTSLFMKMLNKKPLSYEYIMYYLTAAMVNFINKLYDETIKICNDILSINPEFIDAAYFKAQSLFYKEEYEESIEFYKRYLSLLYNINNNPIMLDTRIQIYSIDGEYIAEIDIETSYLKIKNYSGLLDYVFSNEKKDKIVFHMAGIIKSYIELNKLNELVIFINIYILKGTEKELVNFIYYFKDEIQSMEQDKRDKLLKEFNNLNIESIYLNSIKNSLDNKEENTLKDIIKFISLNNIETLNVFAMARVLGSTAINLINNKDVNLSVFEIAELRRVTKYILVQALNKKSFIGLSQEQILKIIYRYIDYSFFVYQNSKQNLNNKEILFLENILLSFQHIENKDLVSAIRAIKDAVIEDEEMAKAMKLYIDTIILN